MAEQPPVSTAPSSPGSPDDRAEAGPPDGPEMGLREARTLLGERVDRARYLDEVTYLTKHGSRVAAIVPVEAARTRAQLEAMSAQTADQAAAERLTFERLHRAGDATLTATEVMWARAYLRLWEVLERLALEFEHEVERRVERELGLEADGAFAADDDGGWSVDQDGPYDAARDHRRNSVRDVDWLKDAEQARRTFAREIEYRVSQLTGQDPRHLGCDEALDWRGWQERIQTLLTGIAAAGPARGNFLITSARQKLADALAQAATVLGELDQVPAPPDTSNLYDVEKELRDAAAASIGTPLVTSYQAMSEPGSVYRDADYAKSSIIRMHQAGKIRLYRYLNGHQTEADPARLHARAPFHVVFISDPPADYTPPRPMVIMDM